MLKADCWRPTSHLDAWRARADLYRSIRHFFDQRRVLEVETPQLAACGVTDLHIDCVAVPTYGYLQSSPEYHMKRLLAAGSGSIWQLARVFRDGEAGRRHNPEFTLLEWYRTEFDLVAIIDETLDVMRLALPNRPSQTITFRQAFLQATGLDPIRASQAELAAYAAQKTDLPELDRYQLIDWIMATDVEASFDKNTLTVVTEFPEWAAALAELKTDEQGDKVALRFEVYTGGVELANGYQELRDGAEQAKRFARDSALRKQFNKPEMQADHLLLDALNHGLPPVSGVALGIDRLLMVKLGVDDIAKVLTFPSDRA